MVGRVPVPSWRKAEPLLSQGRTLRCLDCAREKVKVPGTIGPVREDPESA